MCREQPTIGGILHWGIAVARPISDQVLEVIVTLFLLVLGNIPCTSIDTRKVDKVWVVPCQGLGEVGLRVVCTVQSFTSMDVQQTHREDPVC